MINFTTYFYLFCLPISFLCSIYNFRQHPLHLKLLALLIFIAFINEYIAFWGRALFNLPNNLKVYNIYLPIEFTLYCLYFLCTIRFKWFKFFGAAFLILFPVFWYVTSFEIFKFHNWNSYLNTVENILLIFMATVFYYQLFIVSPLINLKSHSEFWVATALIIYCSCTFPLTGMLNYLLSNYTVYESLAVTLVIVLQIFNIILYALFAYAFLCRINIRKLLLLQ
jgi:hypothetical protein